MAEIIRFDFNIAHDLTLKFDEGRETESAYGPQYMYSTTDGRIFYLDINSDAVSQIERLQIRKNVPFRICKTGRPRQVSWSVQRLDSIEQQLTESLAQRSAARPSSNSNAPTKNVATVPATGSIANNSQVQDTQPRLTSGAQALASCLVAAIDAVSIGQQYARAKGLALEFTSEDVRALSATLYIQHAKQLPAHTLEQNGGAAKWQQ